jgi:hypothetical protein
MAEFEELDASPWLSDCQRFFSIRSIQLSTPFFAGPPNLLDLVHLSNMDANILAEFEQPRRDSLVIRLLAFIFSTPLPGASKF